MVEAGVIKLVEVTPVPYGEKHEDFLDWEERLKEVYSKDDTYVFIDYQSNKRFVVENLNIPEGYGVYWYYDMQSAIAKGTFDDFDVRGKVMLLADELVKGKEEELIEILKLIRQWGKDNV